MKKILLMHITFLAAGCAARPAVSPEAQSTDSSGLTSQETSQKSPERSQIEISDGIREACGIAESDAYFAFNSAKVSSSAQGVLKQLSECFSTGPLKGTEIKLVGHTDPRGDEEYNMVLGGRRADNVKSALVRLGVDDQQLSSTSRGEMNARGSDEASWASDRKVEILK